MIRYVFTTRISDETARSRALELMKGLPEALPEIRDFQSGNDFYRQKNSFDIGMIFSCETTEALDRCLTSKAYGDMKDYILPVSSQNAEAAFVFVDRPRMADYEHGVRHTLMARVDDPAAKDKLVAMIAAMPAAMDFVHDLIVGYDITRGKDSYDIAFSSTCASKEDFFRYIDHAAHIELRDYLREVRREGAMFTMEF